MKDIKECKNNSCIKKYHLLLLTLCVCAVFSCSNDPTGQSNGTKKQSAEREQLDPEEYSQVINEKQKDLTVSHDIGSLKYSATYIPLYYQALLSNRGAKYSDSVIRDFIQLNSNTVFFLFRIANTEIRNKDILKTISDGNDSYYKNLEYFSFKIQNDLHLIVGKDTVPCSISHYERGYDARPDATFMLAFDTQDIHVEQDIQDLVMSFNDQLSGSGRLNFKFPGDMIGSLPVLSIK